MPKKQKEEPAPKGGWQAPFPSYGIPALSRAVGVDKKGRWIWKKNKLTNKDKKKRKIWQKAADKAEKKGRWWFPNPFKEQPKKKGKKK